jgi:hypothetical protein
VKIGELSGAKAVERKAFVPSAPVTVFKSEIEAVKPVRFVAVPALPIVFWLKVGKLVKEAALPFGAKKTVPAPVV